MIRPWRPEFCALKSFLKTSINKKPFFFSAVVVYEKTAINGTKYRILIGCNDSLHARTLRVLACLFA